MFGSGVLGQEIRARLETSYVTSTILVQLLVSYYQEDSTGLVSTASFRILVLSFLEIAYLHFASSLMFSFSIGSNADGFQRVQGRGSLQNTYQSNP